MIVPWVARVIDLLRTSEPDAAGAQALQKVASAVAARIAVQSFRLLPVINVR